VTVTVVNKRGTARLETVPGAMRRPPATSTIPCEFLRAGKKGSPMMLNGRLRLRCAVSLAVQTRD